MDSIMNEAEENTCSICLEKLNECILKCNHKFHPLCRIKIDDNNDNNDNNEIFLSNPYRGN